MKISLKLSGVDGLKKLAAQIKKYPAQAAEAGTQAANDVAETVITRAAQDITGRYNLPASYIREKFTLRKAKRFEDAAVVGARKRGTRLARFEVNQLTVAAPGAKGDARRGIAAGRKQAGASVHVVRGNGRKKLSKAFLMPLRAGTEAGGNGMGLFIRDNGGVSSELSAEETYQSGKGSIKHLYGVSPHQAYRRWIKQNNPAVSDLLAKAFASRMAQQLRKGSK
jgi:hypothetical protein